MYNKIMVDIKILIDLYRWVISPIDKTIDDKILEDELNEYFNKLPVQITEYKETIEYSYDGFIVDMYNYVEYSNNFIFKLQNGGRKYLLKFLKIILLLLIPILVIPIILSRFYKIFENLYMYIIVGVFLLMGLALMSLEKITDKIIKTMKPGDLLKILNSEDENFPITKMERSFGPNPYENITIVESKKKFLCQHYRELVNINKTKNLHELMIYYFATDFLLNIENNDEIIIEYRKQITQVLEYILAFRRNSPCVLFNLAHNELNLLRLDESLQYFKEYYKMYKDNINVNAWIIVLEFVKEDNVLKSQNCT
jgi:hypothetical protein